MIIMKFGGTSIEDAAAMGQVIEIVKSKLDRHPIVVVSAMAGVTDALLKCARLAREGDEREAQKLLEQVLVRRHHEVITQLVHNVVSEKLLRETVGKYLGEVGALLRGLAILGELTPRSLDAVASYGECLSSLILTVALQERGVKAELVDARQVIITDENYTKAAPLLDLCAVKARDILLPALKKGAVPVTQGFIGSTRSGVTSTLGRDGSDYSAALIGALLDAEVIEIWTDVDGVLTADPILVQKAQVLETVTFQEASELAYFGAKVLHPSTILPAMEKNIPVHVFNSRRPEAPGTHIVSRNGGDASHPSVKSIACKKGISVINVYSTRMLLAHGFLRAIFEVFDKHETSVDLVATSEVNVSLTIDDTSRLGEIVKDLEQFSTVTVDHNKAIVCLVGEKMKYTPGIAARIFEAIQNVNINLITQGASEINLSFIVDESDVPGVVNRLHQEFFE